MASFLFRAFFFNPRLKSHKASRFVPLKLRPEFIFTIRTSPFNFRTSCADTGLQR